jgi:hypothetical protein
LSTVVVDADIPGATVRFALAGSAIANAALTRARHTEFRIATLNVCTEINTGVITTDRRPFALPVDQAFDTLGIDPVAAVFALATGFIIEFFTDVIRSLVAFAVRIAEEVLVA